MLNKILHYIKAGQSGMVLVSQEPEDLITNLATYCHVSSETENPIKFQAWDFVDGLTDDLGDPITKASSASNFGVKAATTAIMSPHEAMDRLLSEIRSRRTRVAEGTTTTADSIPLVMVFRNYDRFLCPNKESGPVDPKLLSLTQKILHEGQSVFVFLIMQVTHGFVAPDELREHVEFITHPFPDVETRKHLIVELGVDSTTIDEAVLSATAGLSHAKTVQYVSASLADHGGRIVPSAVFKSKANHLARSSQVTVWAPEFETNIRVKPTDAKYKGVTEAILLEEQDHFKNAEVPKDHTRARIKLVTASSTDTITVEIPTTQFETEWNPERDFYSFKNVVGLHGVKEFLMRGLRPNVPDRAKLKHILLLGVPGTGKSFLAKCLAGEFKKTLSILEASKLHSKWHGESEKNLANMLATVEQIGGFVLFDEFQRMFATSKSSDSGVENRMLGSYLTWLNDQNTNVILSAANDISSLPDELTRSGRVDSIFFVGFPGKEAKQAAWRMYMERHRLPEQPLPPDEFWTPADIMTACRLAELQDVPLLESANWVTPSYTKSQEQMDRLFDWAEKTGCLCAETGKTFRASTMLETGRTTTQEKVVTKPTRRVRSTVTE